MKFDFDKKTIIRIAVIGAVGLAAYFIIKKLSKSKSQVIAETDTGEVVTQVMEDVQNSNAIRSSATITEVEAKSIANKIRDAWGFINDDEEAVYNAFSRVGNLADLYLVMQMYGQYKNEDLEEAIHNRMNAGEIDKVNNILKSKGIGYRF